jgi:hypothetical protein
MLLKDVPVATPIDGVVIVGLVKVLFVKVWVPVRVATVESIAIVTAEDPLKDVPDNPVPIVSGFVVVPPVATCQEGAVDDPFDVNTYPEVTDGNLSRVVVPDAYKISPVVYDVIPVPPLAAGKTEDTVNFHTPNAEL